MTPMLHLFERVPARNPASMQARRRVLVLVLLLLVPASAPTNGQTTAVTLTREQMRDFLTTAKILKGKQTPRGVTRPMRVTLSDGTLTHDAAFSSVDERRPIERFASGKVELEFVDSYKYTLAAYRVAELVGLDHMMPVHVEREWRGDKGSLSWWIDAVMDEGDRLKKKVQPPRSEEWNQQMYRMRVFAQLVADSDRNLGNVLILRKLEEPADGLERLRSATAVKDCRIIGQLSNLRFRPSTE